MIRIFGIGLAAGLALLAPGCAHRAARGPDLVTQYSVIDALLAGDYDGRLPCSELRRHGDFGIGTFDKLDGEMTLLGGAVYAIRADGRVEKAPGAETTPFATVAFFHPDQYEGRPLSGLTYAAFQEDLSRQLPTPNHFYAVWAYGRFHRVTTRSVPRQAPPYVPLAEVTKNQSVFEFTDVEGNLVGFWSPPFAKGVNVPGWHFHFLTRERTGGGHVLDFELRDGAAWLDGKSAVTVLLPDAGDFLRTDLAPDRAEELRRVETDPLKAGASAGDR
ncbi:MAG TPA: acetolactate decarboxylase [Kiritimatiellia bacterium]|nr:acetolactate decarboxylase [Kiritimatiellia bacterium]HRZ10970.1 acetolactate decarboxylase [Kiritimatiellia bacterium]HSA18543.1 acetolactate decarboxylase [Kiritimatiellia bacterium]